jgi:arylsulfatase A
MALGVVLASESVASQKPNIVVILADDLGYGDVQCNNPGRGKILTPHIDKLASEGMRFTDGHSSSGVCSPSRYSLLTGRYHWRSRLQSGIVQTFGEPLIGPDRFTIANLAKNEGYRTAAIGKWHLGWNWPGGIRQRGLLKDDRKAALADDEAAQRATPEQQAVWKGVFSQEIPGGPTANGFDRYFGTDVPNWPPFCFIENDRTVGIPSEFLPKSLVSHQLASKPGPALPDWSLEKILPALAARAEQFVADAAGGGTPYLLYLPLTSPHTPLAVNPEWKGKSALNTYADFVMETDAVVGRVLKAIERSGESENTLVVFTSDNGCAPYIGAADLEKMGHYPSGPFRGYKADAWEGGAPRSVHSALACGGPARCRVRATRPAGGSDGDFRRSTRCQAPGGCGSRQLQPAAPFKGKEPTGARARGELLDGRRSGGARRGMETHPRPGFGRLEQRRRPERTRSAL